MNSVIFVLELVRYAHLFAGLFNPLKKIYNQLFRRREAVFKPLANATELVLMIKRGFFWRAIECMRVIKADYSIALLVLENERV